MVTFGNFWQLMATYGNVLWQLMATFGNFWQLMATNGNLWQLMATYGNLWQLMATDGISSGASLPASNLIRGDSQGDDMNCGRLPT